MASVLPFDELNRFKSELPRFFDETGTRIKSRKDYDSLLDMLEDLLLLAYAQGNAVTNANLLSGWEPTLDDVGETVDAKVAGKTWRERVREYFDNGGTVDDIARIAETETHRVSNTAALEAAKHGGATQKTWVTMMDDRVRETHDYLEGVTVGIDDEFITYDGDRASAPGLFSLPQNNVNCRCELIFS